MHKDTIQGAAKQAVGSVKEAIGKATGDQRLEAEGLTQRAAGKIERSVGDLKSAAREALKK